MAHLFHLKRKDELLGILTVQDTDQPWFYTSFTPTKAFEEVRFLFEEELQTSKSKNWASWEKVQHRIANEGLYIVDAISGNKKSSFILHIEDNKAKLRFIPDFTAIQNTDEQSVG